MSQMARKGLEKKRAAAVKRRPRIPVSPPWDRCSCCGDTLFINQDLVQWMVPNKDKLGGKAYVVHKKCMPSDRGAPVLLADAVPREITFTRHL